jgi:hypothetical protein
MKTKIIGILVITLLIATAIPAVGTLNKINTKENSSSQNLGVEWSQTFGGSDYDTFYDVYCTNDGGYIMSGKHEENDLYYPYIVKVDSMGNEEWNWSIKEFEYEGETYDILENWVPGIMQASDGNYVACLYFQVEYEGEIVAVGGLLKLDTDGNLVWLVYIGEEDVWWIVPTELIEIEDGFVIFGSGNYNDFVEGDWLAILVKTDFSGEIQWHKFYDYGEYKDEGYALSQTSDGGFLLTGSVDNEQPNSQYRMIKTDSNGNEEWSKLYGGDFQDVSYNNDCFQTADGGYIMGGQGDSYQLFDTNGLNPYIIRVDSEGNMIWDKIYGSKYLDTCWSFTMTDDEKYVFCVTINVGGFSGDRSDTHLVKLDDDGNIEWVQIFGGPDREVGISVRQTSDGGFIVAGRNGRSYSTSSDAMLTKFAPFENDRPNTPTKPSGSAEGEPEKDYTFSTTCEDPDGDELIYLWDWGDDTDPEWSDTNQASHNWSEYGDFYIKVMAKDENGGESDWSETFKVSMPRTKAQNRMVHNFLQKYLNLSPILKILLQRLGM